MTLHREIKPGLSGRRANLSSHRARPTRAVAATLWLAAAGLAAAAVSITATGWGQGGEAAALEGHLAQAREDVARLSAEAEGTPDAAALAAQAERVAFFNALTGPRALPLPSVLTRLAEAMPDRVWLGQVAYDAGTGRLSVQLRAEDEVALPVALARLEAIEDFGEVILERQVRLREQDRTLVQFDVRAEVAR